MPATGQPSLRVATLYDDIAASMTQLRESHSAVDRSRDIVLKALEDGRAHYGINTGFGVLANKRIDSDQLAELASISERRTYLLLEGHDGLPKLLMQDTGVNSGFMIPQYTAAALVSENKVLCHPASVDSIPTSLGQEDHVSMGSISAIKLLSVLQNVEQVLAVELLTASQALDFRSPMKPGAGVLAAHRFLRERIPHAHRDYEVRSDLELCAELLRVGTLVDAVEAVSGRLG